MPKKTKENKNRKKKNTKKRVESEVIKDTNDNKFNFDEEIVIGLRRIDEPEISREKSKKNKKRKSNNVNNIKNITPEDKKKSKNKRNKGGNNKNKNSKNNDFLESEEPEIIIKSKYMDNYEETSVDKKSNAKKNKSKKNNKKNNTYKKPPKKLTKKQELARMKRKIVFRIIKWITLIAIIIGGVIYALLSPIFNIHEITVQGNSKIQSETIISLSGLNIDQNIFKYRTSEIEDKIKQNAYINTVDIKRKLPNEVEITVTERKATFKLNYGNAYAYINNQGYILELTSVKGTLPLVTGYSTSQEEIKEGNRLSTEDLEKLGGVLQIMEAASSVDDNLRKKIKEINISDKNNYILELTSEKKTVYLGDVSNLSTKMLWIQELIKSEDGVEGTIMINVDLNKDKPYFNEKV